MNDTDKIQRLEQIVLGLANPTDANRETTQEAVKSLAKDLFVAEATHMFERDAPMYATVEEAGVALGEFLGKIERGELVLNDAGEYVPA